MKKLLFILLLLPLLSIAQTRGIKADAMAKLPWANAPVGPVKVVATDSVSVGAIEADNSNEFGEIAPITVGGWGTNSFTAGAIPWVNGSGQIEWIAPNTSDTVMALLQYGGFKPYYQAIVTALLLNLRNGDGLMLGPDTIWRNAHDAFTSWSIRQSRKMQKNIIGESFPFMLVQGASTVADGTVKCSLLDIPFTDTVRSISFQSNVQGVFTGNNTNSLIIYRSDSTSGVLTKEGETANDANIWKHTAGEFVTVAIATPFVASRDSIYYGCGLHNNDGSGSPTVPQIGHATSVSTNNLGVITQDFTHSQRSAFTLAGQNTAPTNIILSTTTVIGNAPYFRVNRQ